MQQTGLEMMAVMEKANLNAGDEALLLCKLLAAHTVGASHEMPEVLQRVVDMAIVGALQHTLRQTRKIDPEKAQAMMDKEHASMN
jgi:hypothetical protein